MFELPCLPCDIDLTRSTKRFFVRIDEEGERRSRFDLNCRSKHNELQNTYMALNIRLSTLAVGVQSR